MDCHGNVFNVSLHLRLNQWLCGCDFLHVFVWLFGSGLTSWALILIWQYFMAYVGFFGNRMKYVNLKPVVKILIPQYPPMKISIWGISPPHFQTRGCQHGRTALQASQEAQQTWGAQLFRCPGTIRDSWKIYENLTSITSSCRCEDLATCELIPNWVAF